MEIEGSLKWKQYHGEVDGDWDGKENYNKTNRYGKVKDENKIKEEIEQLGSSQKKNITN